MDETERIDYHWINLSAGFRKKDHEAFEEEDLTKLMDALGKWADKKGLVFVGGMIFADEA